MKSERSIFDEIDAEADASADAEGLADIEAGRVISHEAMKAWLLSWGTPDELPPPRVGD
jgi:predicted transcriptional regulator